MKVYKSKIMGLISKTLLRHAKLSAAVGVLSTLFAGGIIE